MAEEAKPEQTEAEIQAKNEAEIQQMVDMDNAEEAKELEEVAAQKIVSENAAPPMSGAMQAAKMAAMDKKEDKAELKEVEKMDAVNEESKAAVGALFAKAKAKKAERDEEEIQAMIDMDNEEEAAELKKVEEMDAVNEESKAAVGALFAKVKAKKAEKDEAEIQQMIDMDNEEEAAELKNIEEMDAVNEESKAAVGALFAKVKAKKAEKDEAEIQQMIDMDNKEEEAELKKVEQMDAVNEDSKAAVAGFLAAKKEKQAEMEEEEEVEAADEPKPQYIKMDNVSINVNVKQAMDDLYAKGSTRRHVMIRIDEKKKKKKRSYYAELASTGEGCLQPVLDTIAADLNTVFFAAFRVDCSDSANSKRQKYVWSQIQGNIDQMRAAKLMSFSKDINDLALKQDCTIRSVTHENYQTEFSMENLSQALHGKAAHPPDQYDFGAGMVIQMKN